MRGLRIATLALAGCAPVHAQYVRPSTPLAGGVPGPASGLSIATSGGRVVAGWHNPENGHVYASSADGPNLPFSGPLVVDDATPTIESVTEPSSCCSAGGTHFVLWRDEKPPLGAELFLDDEDGCELSMVDKGYPVGAGRVETFGYDCVDKVPDPIHHFVLMQVDPTPALLQDDEAWFARSTDGGASFLPPVRLSPPGVDVDAIGLEADGDRVTAVWSDDRFGPVALFAAISQDCGATFGSDIMLSLPSGATAGVAEIAVEVRDTTVLVAWESQGSGFGGADTILAVVSDDGGLSFSPPAALPVFSCDLCVDVGTLDVAIAAQSGSLLVSWADDGLGTSFPAVAVSTDAGATWATTALDSAGSAPLLLAAGAPSDELVAYWTSAGTPARDLEARLSRDGGLSWTTILTVDDNAGDVDEPVAAYDATYGDFRFGWLADDPGEKVPYTGGFRPQTLTPVGWNPGSTLGRFDFSGFDPPAVPFPNAWALLSQSLGSCLLYTSPSPRDQRGSRMPSSA